MELGGVRFVTIAGVTERVGLHRTGVRRYYASKEELLLGLAERGWWQWRERVEAELDGASGLTPEQVADAIVDSVTSLPVFCDLLAHVPMSLEGEVDLERARRYKANSFAAFDQIADSFGQASRMTPDQVHNLLAAALPLAAGLWQASHPTPTLVALYAQEPRWGHVALDWTPRLQQLLRAVAVGLTHTPQ